MTWAFVNRGAAAVIQSRPRWTESLHGDSAGVVALKTCCRHTSVGRELGRLVPGRGGCGGMRPAQEPGDGSLRFVCRARRTRNL